MTSLRAHDAGSSTVFIDQLTVPGLLVLLVRVREAAEVRWFEPPTRAALSILQLLRGLRLRSVSARAVGAHVGQIRDAAGSRLPSLYEEVRTVCDAIRAAHFDAHPLVTAMRAVWDPRRVALHFDKLAEHEVRREVLRFALIDWLRRRDGQAAEPVVIITRPRWWQYLAPRAASLGLRPITYPALPDITRWLRTITRAGRVAMVAVSRRARPRRPLAVTAETKGPPPPEISIAVRYGQTGVTFDPSERSEFFWLAGTGVPPDSLILYNYTTGDQDGESLEELRRRNMRVLGRGQGVPSWQPTPRVMKVFWRTLRQIATAVTRCWLRGVSVGAYVPIEMMRLAAEYAYWLDFFSVHKVRIHVATLHTTVAQILAMDTVRGVAIAYQYSASNIIFPTALLTAGEHVQFVFSPRFEPVWRAIHAPAEAIIPSGFVYDRALDTVPILERVTEVRQRLRDQGAQFILCFFDENSADRWDIPAPHAEAAEDYAYLARWLLDDPSLGIIFKPKKYADLFERIAGVRPLLHEALHTGRCVFLGDPAAGRRVFPAEAASVADLCIGRLNGTTAALEASLAGKPTLLLDTDAFRTHPIYRWGWGSVLFDTWPSLRAAVGRFRADPHARGGLGDWSAWIDTYDPYRDGKAGMRIGLFIQQVREALQAGNDPSTAIRRATAQLSIRLPPAVFPAHSEAAH